MALKKNSKKNGPISIDDLSIQDFENLAKQVNENRNSTFYGLNQQLLGNLNNSLQDAEYTKEEIFQMRENNDNRLYKSPIEVTSSYGCVWENGKVGYFIPFDHKPLSGDFLPAKFGGGQRDGKGLRFVQNHKDRDKTLFLFTQNNDIIVSGFGEYVLQNWGSDINVLYKDYANLKYKKLAEQWRNNNFPKKIDQLVKLNLLKNLRELEIKKWNEATISDFLTKSDNIKLKFCIDELSNWLDTCVHFENNRGEIEYVKNIQLQKITIGNGWANGKSGQFNDFDNNYQYRFCETDENGYHYLLNDEEQRKLPVLACGFIAWLIKHWGTDTQTIYSGYLQARLNQYKSSHKNDADVLKRDLDSEFFEQYNSQEEKFVLQSEAIFDFISDDDVKKIKNYIINYFDFISRYLPYKVYNSFDEAIRECEIEDKILLHSITKFLNPSYRLPINIFNDILQIKAMYLNEPSKCIKYIRDNYNTTADEYYILIHILKSKLDRDCDLQILLPDISAKKSLTDSFDDLLRSIRRKLTVHFDLLAGAVLVDSSDPQKIYSRVNITDEAALYFLSTQPDTRKYFCLLPSNVDELIEEYKFKQSVNANSDLSFKSKGQKSKHVKDDLNKQFEEREIKVLEFEQYFKPSFRGIGEYNINHFVSLIEDLKQNRSAKEFAEIALLIHESKHMNSRKPVYFTEWYQIFCECVGCEQKKYDPKDLRPIRESVKNLFGYLLI